MQYCRESTRPAQVLLRSVRLSLANRQYSFCGHGQPVEWFTDCIAYGVTNGGCGPRRSDESVTGPFADVKGITNVAGAWRRRSGAPGSDHLSHRGGPPGRAQGVRLKRLLLAPCRHCRLVNPMITLIQQAKYPDSPCMRACRRESVRFRMPQGWSASLISFFSSIASWWNKENRVLILPILLNPSKYRPDPYDTESISPRATHVENMNDRFGWRTFTFR